MPGFSERYSSVHLTAAPAAAERYWRNGPKKTKSPFSSRIDGLKSCPYAQIGEPEIFMIVLPCSVLTFQSACRRTSCVIGSTRSSASLWRRRLSWIESSRGGTYE